VLCGEKILLAGVMEVKKDDFFFLSNVSLEVADIFSGVKRMNDRHGMLAHDPLSFVPLLFEFEFKDDGNKLGLGSTEITTLCFHSKSDTPVVGVKLLELFFLVVPNGCGALPTHGIFILNAQTVTVEISIVVKLEKFLEQRIHHFLVVHEMESCSPLAEISSFHGVHPAETRPTETHEGVIPHNHQQLFVFGTFREAKLFQEGHLSVSPAKMALVQACV